MTLTPEIAPEVLAACQRSAAEASQAFSRALDAAITLTPAETSELSLEQLPDACGGPGLLVVLNVGEVAAVVAIPEATQLLPKWCAAPDATGASKLATLAQELGTLLLPETHAPNDFAAFYVDDLAAALTRGELATRASTVSLKLETSEHAGTAWLLWPVAKPQALATGATETAAPPSQTAAPPSSDILDESPWHGHADSLEAALPQLPSYTRSLLKIRVPIVVTLASSKQPLNRIIELAPGSIIPFEKSCEDTLSLEVNNHEIAIGEVVKVGDKFGLRITSMILPPERFLPLKKRSVECTRG
jgi:flagellar motor switch/type III secretory pathway protein FliN